MIGTEPRVVVLGAARTPMGRYRGELRGWSAPELGARAILGALRRAGLEPGDPDECLMGCVLPAGQGQAPARQAALGAGLPYSTPCDTVNKMCGSGMKTFMLASDRIRLGDADIALAGGAESMSRAPYLIDRVPETGKPDRDAPLRDHMFLDGLTDAYEAGRLMGTYAEDCAERYQFSREEQDEYAISSLNWARRAAASGAFAAEIEPLPVRNGEIGGTIESDELPRFADPGRIPSLRPVFREGGTVTAANSSAISDGAAFLVLASEDEARQRKLAPLAGIVAQAGHAQEPGLFTSAPVPAIRAVLQCAGWQLDDVDLWEINEAFAVVPMVAMRELGIPRDRLNVYGGACALGHPIGASGARILVTLLHGMIRRRARRGVAAICIGGGEATAVALERFEEDGEQT